MDTRKWPEVALVNPKLGLRTVFVFLLLVGCQSPSETFVASFLNAVQTEDYAVLSAAVTEDIRSQFDPLYPETGLHRVFPHPITSFQVIQTTKLDLANSRDEHYFSLVRVNGIVGEISFRNVLGEFRVFSIDFTPVAQK